MKRINATVVILLSVAFQLAAIPTVRIKDIATVRGARSNQLLGIGIVTGLSGKGDSPGLGLLKNSVANLLSHFGIEVSPADIKSRNCAIVTVSVEFPAFVRQGDSIDVTVASLQDARSLEGGVLLQSALQASNGQVYAVAQGRINVASGTDSVKTVGRIPSGAIVERDVSVSFATEATETTGSTIQLILRNPDFFTAAAVTKAIASAFKDIKVESKDAALITIVIPRERDADPVGFIAELENITVQPDAPARVVIDSATGVIIVGEKVRIGKVLVSYKKMAIRISPFYSNADDSPDAFVLPDLTTVDEFVKFLQDVGVKNDAIIGIMQAIDRAGALFGELVVM